MTPENSDQKRAVVHALASSLEAIPAAEREALLRDIPVYPENHVGPDFDELLGAQADAPVVFSRLAATNHASSVFLRLLAGACSRSDDTLALALLEALPSYPRVPVSKFMTRMVAGGFGKSPNPSARLLDRITDPSGPLEFLPHEHSSDFGVETMVHTITSVSIKANSDKHLDLVLSSPRLFSYLIGDRHDFWLLVSQAATARSDVAMAGLARLQDHVFASMRNPLATPAQREKEQLASNQTFHESLEKLAGTTGQEQVGAARTLIQMLGMDPPLHPTDYGTGANSDWRTLSVLAPIQSLLGESYMKIARPLLHRGKPDIIMDGLVFGSDQWWAECIDQVSRNPSTMASQMSPYDGFLESYLDSRILPDNDSRLFSAIDDIQEKSSAWASAVADRLVRRLPELSRAAGSPAQRRDWADDMSWLANESKPMTAAMFQAIAMGLTTEPSAEPSMPSPRM